MMRSPSVVATAVRRPDGTIAVRRQPYVSLAKRVRLLGLPVVRGAVALVEAMRLGMTSLTYSADQAVEEAPEERRGWRHRLTTAATILVSFAVGLFIFFWLPLVMTERTVGTEASGFAFNLVDGIFRLVMLLAYMAVISMWGEMRRVFQYHGAEHKSIACVEAGEALVPERVARFSRFHPRCGTSFLLLVITASIFVFMLLGRPDTIAARLERFLFIPLIGGVSFELTRLAGKYGERTWARPLVAPGLWLQRLTTREPSLDQIEVAIRSIQEVTEQRGGRVIPI